MDLLKEKEAGKFLQWSVQTLRNRRLKGLPPSYIRVGRSIRYSMVDLLKFLEAGRVEVRDGK